MSKSQVTQVSNMSKYITTGQVAMNTNLILLFKPSYSTTLAIQLFISYEAVKFLL